MGITEPHYGAQTAVLPEHFHADVMTTRKLEHAILELEDAVYATLDSSKGHAFHDVDFLYWERTLKNIATPISLALSEYKGPRRFHHHYRHDPQEDSHLLPVYESPLLMLVRVARDALTRCNETAGVPDPHVARLKSRLEHALRLVLSSYNATHG